jgi:hypothetical protein
LSSVGQSTSVRGGITDVDGRDKPGTIEIVIPG